MQTSADGQRLYMSTTSQGIAVATLNASTGSIGSITLGEPGGLTQATSLAESTDGGTLFATGGDTLAGVNSTTMAEVFAIAGPAYGMATMSQVAVSGSNVYVTGTDSDRRVCWHSLHIAQRMASLS